MPAASWRAGFNASLKKKNKIKKIIYVHFHDTVYVSIFLFVAKIENHIVLLRNFVVTWALPCVAILRSFSKMRLFLSEVLLSEGFLC